MCTYTPREAHRGYISTMMPLDEQREHKTHDDYVLVAWFSRNNNSLRHRSISPLSDATDATRACAEHRYNALDPTEAHPSFRSLVSCLLVKWVSSIWTSLSSGLIFKVNTQNQLNSWFRQKEIPLLFFYPKSKNYLFCES